MFIAHQRNSEPLQKRSIHTTPSTYIYMNYMQYRAYTYFIACSCHKINKNHSEQRVNLIIDYIKLEN